MVKYLTFILLLLAVSVVADSIPFTGTTMINDNRMHSQYATTNYDSDSTIACGKTATPYYIITSTMDFTGLEDTLAAKDADSIILYLSFKTKSGFTWTNDSIQIYALNVSCVEATASHTYRVGGGDPIAWTVPGGLGASSDYHDTVICAMSIAPMTVENVYGFNITSLETYNWLSNGILFKTNTMSNGEYLVFRSSNNATVPARMVVYYTPAASGAPQIIGTGEDDD